MTQNDNRKQCIRCGHEFSLEYDDDEMCDDEMCDDCMDEIFKKYWSNIE